MFKETINGKLRTLQSINNNEPWSLNFWVSEYKNKENLEIVKKFLLYKESELLKKYSGITDGGTGLGPESTTALYSEYNLFAEYPIPSLIDIKQFFSNEYEQFLSALDITVEHKKITSWYNILRYGQQIDKHFHGDLSRASSNFIIDCYNSSTIYELPFNCGNYELINFPGSLTIFNSLVPHWTTKNLVYKERISLAADFYDNTYYNNDLAHVMLNF